MDFAAFQATRVHGDASKTYGDGSTGFTYGDGLQIADSGDSLGKYWLVLENRQFVDDDLAKLECMLWQWSLDDDHVLSGDSGFDLDRFIQGYCESRGRAIDGDLFAHLFSGPSPFTVAQASDLLEAGFVHPLYCGIAS